MHHLNAQLKKVKKKNAYEQWCENMSVFCSLEVFKDE